MKINIRRSLRRLRWSIAAKAHSFRWKLASAIAPGPVFGDFALIQNYPDCPAPLMDSPDGWRKYLESAKSPDRIHIGAQYFWRGRLRRVAVSTSVTPSAQQLDRSLCKLAMAIGRPDDPSQPCAWDDDVLTQKTIDADADGPAL